MRLYTEFLGGYAEGVTPVPIPNTEVKPLRADGTAWVAVWESRSPPGIIMKKPHFNRGGAFLRVTRPVTAIPINLTSLVFQNHWSLLRFIRY